MRNLNPVEGIFKPKDIYNPYLLAGVAGRIASNVEVDSRIARSVDALVNLTALDATSITKPTSLEPQKDIALWHGTGRYKYEDGKIVDVLDGMAVKGSIEPHDDKFDMLGDMRTVSLARSRMYARAYADMHGKGHEELERYGKSLFWASAFLGAVAVEAAKEAKVWRPSGYYRMLDHLRNANAVEWYKKVTRVENPGVTSVYKHGSDIEKNYPVLIAVKDVEPVKTSKAVALHEVCTIQPISLSEDVEYIEVPRNNIEETEEVLGGLDIRPMEEGEWYSIRCSFTEHIHGKI